MNDDRPESVSASRTVSPVADVRLASRSRLLVAVLVALAVTAWAVSAGTPPAGADVVTKTVTVTLDAANSNFIDTGIKLGQGDSAAISASGNGTCHSGGSPDCPGGPDGAGITCANAPNGGSPPGPAGPPVPYGAVAGKIGAGDGFFIGSGKTVTGVGELLLVYNDCTAPAGYSDNAGSFQVTIQAQLHTYTVGGTVTDQAGQPVSGVTISATASDGSTTSATSGTDGAYSLTVPPGQTHLSSNDPKVCVVGGPGACATTTDLDVEQNTTVNWRRMGPVVTGVSPGSGPIKGGQRLTITGSGFTGAHDVCFRLSGQNFGNPGGCFPLSAAAGDVVSDTRITFFTDDFTNASFTHQTVPSQTYDVSVVLGSASGIESAKTAADQYTARLACIGPAGAGAADGLRAHAAGCVPVGKIGRIIGPGLYVQHADGTVQKLSEGSDIYQGDTIISTQGTRAEVEFTIGGRAGINGDSTVHVASERSLSSPMTPSRFLKIRLNIWNNMIRQSTPSLIQTNGGVMGIKG